jgi:hypothetical protein
MDFPNNASWVHNAVMDALTAENPGIGLYSETGLHGSLKALYAAEPGARVEVRVFGKVVDVLLPGEFVEIQTRNLGSICAKVQRLACNGPVRVVYPIPVVTTIRRLDPASGAIVSERRSSARRDLYSAFDELVHATDIVASPNVRVDLVLVRAVENRQRDGRGSWRRRGDRILSRDLEAIVETVSLETSAEWLSLIPSDLPHPYDSRSLGEALAITPFRARKILYTFCRAGLLRDAGRQGRRKLYARSYQ